MPKSLYLNDVEQAIWLLEAMCESGISYEQGMEVIKRFNAKRRPTRYRKTRRPDPQPATEGT